jgi:hypothetical protein
MVLLASAMSRMDQEGIFFLLMQPTTSRVDGALSELSTGLAVFSESPV